MRADGVAALLKVARSTEERRGARLMAWWSAVGCPASAPVLHRSEAALLLLRGQGDHDLTRWAADGRELEALSVLGGLAARIPAEVPPPSLRLIPLERWFRALLDRTGRVAGASDRAVVDEGRRLARALLASTDRVRVLHGDLHHGNVVDFAAPGSVRPDFRLIDPKGLLGDAAFDGVAAVLNPDRLTPPCEPWRLHARAGVVAEALAVDASRLLAWVQAFTALSALWQASDGADPRPGLDWSRLAARAREP